MKVYGVIALLVVVAAMGGLVMAGASTNIFLSDDTGEPQVQKNQADMIPDIEPEIIEAVTEPVLVVEQPRQEPAVLETPKKETVPKIDENKIDRNTPKIEKDETPKSEKSKEPAKSDKDEPAPKSEKKTKDDPAKPEKEKPAPKSEKKTEPAKPDKPAPKKHAVKYDEDACLEIIGKMLSSTDPSPEKLAEIERELKAKNCGNN